MRYRGWIALALVLISIELTLRATGALLVLPGKLRNSIEPEDARRVRILALGESTTTEWSGMKLGSWPRQLQTELRARGVDARVYNEGVPGTQMALVLARLPALLEAYRPEIVVTMLGTNDRGAIRFASGVGESSGFGSLRLVKAARWLVEEARVSLKGCRLAEGNASPPEGGLGMNGEPLEEVEATLRRTQKDPRVIGRTLAGIGVAWGAAHPEPEARERILELAKRALELSPSEHAAIYLRLTADPEENGACSPFGRELFERCGLHLPDDVVSALAGCLRQERPVSADAFRAKNLVLSDPQAGAGVRAHYRALHELLSSKGILHVAMQYPTEPLEPLKEDLLGYVDTVFVSNRENFTQALRKHTYDDLFVDRFKGSWGHPTEKGHQVIAAALAPVLAQAIAMRPPLAKRAENHP